MYYRSALILVLFTLYCYASPIRSIDQDHQITNLIKQQSDIQEPKASQINDEWVTLQSLHEYEFLRMLCELYGHCDKDNTNGEDQMFEYEDTEHKRMSPWSFHDVPKHHKRSVASMFAGYSRFG